MNRSPDYFLKIGDYQIIVEVTEFKLNEEEKEQLSELRKKGAVAHWSSTERRIRDEIEKKNKQIKPFVQRHNCPSILLIYDDREEFAGTNSDNIKYAMYGKDSHIVGIDSNFDGPPVYIRNKFGGRRKMTKDEKTYISAIGHLFTDNKNLKINLYHNYYSKCPIEIKKIKSFSQTNIK